MPDTKNRRNLAKHKVSFETARWVFDDPHVLSIQDRVVEGEERWQTVGIGTSEISKAKDSGRARFLKATSSW